MSSSNITPATLVAMTGLSQGTGLQIVASVTAANIALNAVPNTAPYYGIAQSTAIALGTLSGKLFSGGPAGFAQILGQVQSHIENAISLKTSMNTMANMAFDDLGSGVTSVSSITDQGLSATFGNVAAAATLVKALGPLFDLRDIEHFGTSSGFVETLTTNKLANVTGVNAALIANGVDLTDIHNPIYADIITQTLAKITDSTTIATVVDQFGLSPFGKINNLGELINPIKMINPSRLVGLTANVSVIATKFSDIGASFSNSSVASMMIANVATPTIPNLDASATSLNVLVSGQAPFVSAMTGSGSGPLGLPTVTDFTIAVAGGAAIDAVNALVGNVTIASLSSAITNANNLFSVAGINLTVPPSTNFNSVRSFATGLHNIGADTTGIGTADVLTKMATTNQYGDAIKAVLIEGKNLAAMSANGIKPLTFGS